MKKLATLLALSGASLFANPASAATVLPSCAASDISSTSSPTNTPFASTTCSGFFAGNLLSNNAGDKAQQVSALNSLLGSSVYSVATFNFGIFTSLTGLAGLKTIDFPGVLNGQTLIGVHYGVGADSPSDVAGNTGNKKSDSTAFYLLNAGTNIDKFYLTYGASSTVVLYSTGRTQAAVPEPATWAMMLVGFGLIGFAMRKRQNLLAQKVPNSVC